MRLFQEPSTIKSDDMKGRIHSTESFGTVDGPGIRYVVFVQGCPMRCAYCHNPDTWEIGAGKEISPEEIINEFNKNRAFYQKGGITVSGGEPLLQTEFVTKLFSLAKKEGIHTAIDTSGIAFNPSDTESIDALMDKTDLVMLDIKHIDPKKHKLITGHDNKNILLFAKYLESKKIPVWIRHVVVKGLTDEENDLVKLGEFIGKLKNLKGLDVLPYHTMGVHKYKELNIPYSLEGIEPLDTNSAIEAKKSILYGIQEVRR